jgi:hypothetical protein
MLFFQTNYYVSYLLVMGHTLCQAVDPELSYVQEIKGTLRKFQTQGIQASDVGVLFNYMPSALPPRQSEQLYLIPVVLTLHRISSLPSSLAGRRWLLLHKRFAREAQYQVPTARAAIHMHVCSLAPMIPFFSALHTHTHTLTHTHKDGRTACPPTHTAHHLRPLLDPCQIGSDSRSNEVRWLLGVLFVEFMNSQQLL